MREWQRGERKLNEFLTLICDAMEHTKIGGFMKLRELEPELKRQYDVLDQQRRDQGSFAMQSEVHRWRCLLIL